MHGSLAHSDNNFPAKALTDTSIRLSYKSLKTGMTECKQ